jgi:hypothetical protein
VNGSYPRSLEGQISPIKEENHPSEEQIIPEKVKSMTLALPTGQLPLTSEVRLRRSASDVNVSKKTDKQTKSSAGLLPPPSTLKHTDS